MACSSSSAASFASSSFSGVMDCLASHAASGSAFLEPDCQASAFSLPSAGTTVSSLLSLLAARWLIRLSIKFLRYNRFNRLPTGKRDRIAGPPSVVVADTQRVPAQMQNQLVKLFIGHIV